MFRSEALCYFIYEVKSKCATAIDAFQMMQARFTTAENLNTYTTEWNTLSFQDIQSKDKTKSLSEVLDIPYQRGQYSSLCYLLSINIRLSLVISFYVQSKRICFMSL